MMASGPNHEENLGMNSLVAYQILEEHFIASKYIKLQPTSNNETEFITNLLLSCMVPYAKFEFTGSLAEGFGTLYALTGSKADLDVLQIIKCFRGFGCVSDIEDNDSILQFIIESEESDPGYGKLMAILEEDTDDNDFCRMFCRKNGRLYLSSSEVKINLKLDLLKLFVQNCLMMPTPCDFFNINGPATTMHMRDMNYGITNGFSMTNIDMVVAIPFQSWPSVASEWIHRTRHQDWPTRELIQTITQRGCFMVPKGSRGSPEENLEWAFSFSHVEPLLIQSMNDVMVKTYATLKLLRISVCDEECDKVLSSYIIKTSVLWEAEECEKSSWTPENLLQCVRYCLRRIKSWFEANNAPHYFIRSQNLLYRRAVRDLRERILCLLESVLDQIEVMFQIVPIFAHALSKRSAYEIIQSFQGRGVGLSLIQSYIFSATPLIENLCRQLTLTSSISALSIYFGSFINRDSPFCSESLRTMQETTLSVFERPISSTAVDLVGSILIVKQLFLHFLLECTSYMNRNKRRYSKRAISQNIEKVCCRSQTITVLGNLMQLLFQWIVQENHRKFEKSACYILNCLLTYQSVRPNASDSETLAGNMFQTCLSVALPSILNNLFAEYSSGVAKSFLLIDDIHLTEPELSFLPPVLRLELECRLGMDLDRQPSYRIPNEFVLSVNSEVLFYFLCFCYYHKKDKNIEKFAFLQRLKAMCCEKSTSWRNLAWNLLGYSYSEMGLFKEAVKAYCESVKYQDGRPDLRAISKATPVHMAIFLNKKFNL